MAVLSAQYSLYREMEGAGRETARGREQACGQCLCPSGATVGARHNKNPTHSYGYGVRGRWRGN